MNKYKIVAHLLAPELQDGGGTPDAVIDFFLYSKGYDNEEFLRKYPIDSNVFSEFKDNSEYIITSDDDGIYLWEKVK